MVSALLLTKILFITAITNIICLFLVAFSCRCAIAKLSQKIAASKAYSAFYNKHCLYWGLLMLSVIIHIIVAYKVIGIPF